MDALCRTQPDKRLLNWRILAPGRVIFQEYFKSQMDVCQKFSEGKIRCVQSFPTYLLTYLLMYLKIFVDLTCFLKIYTIHICKNLKTFGFTKKNQIFY